MSEKNTEIQINSEEKIAHQEFNENKGDDDTIDGQDKANENNKTDNNADETEV